MTNLAANSATLSNRRNRTRRDPVATRRRILRAATILFAEKGPDAASIDDIASASGYNRRMIYHYFENKRGLYLAVLENVYSRIRTLVVDKAVESTTLAGLVDTLMDKYSSFLQANPEFVAMLQWENAHGAAGLTQIQLGDFRSRLLGPIRDVLRNGDRSTDGGTGDGTNAEQEEAAFHVVMMCISTCGYCFTNRDSISVVFQHDLSDPLVMKRWLKHAKEIVLRGMAG